MIFAFVTGRKPLFIFYWTQFPSLSINVDVPAAQERAANVNPQSSFMTPFLGAEATSKTATFVCTNLSYLTLEGPGRQTVDTRSTSGVPLKSLGYNGSNKLLEKSVASKLSPQQADELFYQSDTQILEKWKFFSLRPPGQKRKEISVWVLWVK